MASASRHGSPVLPAAAQPDAHAPPASSAPLAAAPSNRPRRVRANLCGEAIPASLRVVVVVILPLRLAQEQASRFAADDPLLAFLTSLIMVRSTTILSLLHLRAPPR